MQSRALVLACGLLLLAGCASSASDVASASADISGQEWRNGLDRTLAPEVPVPTVAEIGRRLDAVLDAETEGFAKGDGYDSGACNVTDYRAADGRTASFVKCPITTIPAARPMNVLRFYPATGGNLPDRIYADLNLDGLVDSFSNAAGPIVEADDDDFDGRVDRIVETVASLGADFDLKPFGPGWQLEAGATYANRIREDADKNGKFELESVTAHDPTHAHVLGFER